MIVSRRFKKGNLENYEEYLEALPFQEWNLEKFDISKMY
jgi:hypothetical protein